MGRSTNAGHRVAPRWSGEEPAPFRADNSTSTWDDPTVQIDNGWRNRYWLAFGVLLAMLALFNLNPWIDFLIAFTVSLLVAAHGPRIAKWRVAPEQAIGYASVLCLLVLAGYGLRHVLSAAGVDLPEIGSHHRESAGSVAHTWTDYMDAGGTQGPLIPHGRPVRIACRVEGFRVADGNDWWYRIASPPWNGNYYVSADAFYNNGNDSGSLRGTPFVDYAIPLCADQRVIRPKRIH